MGLLDPPAAPRSSTTKLSKSISGSSNVTLTASECLYRVIELTSATQTITITVPTGAAFTLINATNYAQNIKRAGSSVSLVLDSGMPWEVQS